MSDFLEFAKLFGLPLAMALVAITVMWRLIVVQNRDLKAQYEARLAEKDRQSAALEVERDYYRDKWNQSLGLNEVQAMTASALARGKRGTGR